MSRIWEFGTSGKENRGDRAWNRDRWRARGGGLRVRERERDSGNVPGVDERDGRGEGIRSEGKRGGRMQGAINSEIALAR